MKKRVNKYGDENIIMGYNNGALSAMTEDEFRESIKLAVTNENGSSETALFGFYPMSSEGLGETERNEVCAFADGALITAPDSASLAPFTGDNISAREGKADGKSEADLKNPVMTGFNRNLGQYIKKGARGIGHILISQLKARKYYINPTDNKKRWGKLFVICFYAFSMVGRVLAATSAGEYSIIMCPPC